MQDESPSNENSGMQIDEDNLKIKNFGSNCISHGGGDNGQFSDISESGFEKQ